MADSSRPGCLSYNDGFRPLADDCNERPRMNRETGTAAVSRWRRVAGWFLFVSYAFGSPVFAVVEAKTGVFSARFNYPPELLYLVSGVQFFCALVLFRRALAPWSTVILTVVSLGAAVSHLKINSVATALPALLYTVIQVWYGIQMYRQHRGSRRPPAAAA